MQRREPTETMEQARETAEEIQQEAKARAERVKEQLRDAAQTAGERMRDVRERTMEKSSAATEEVRGFVRRHPLASLAVGLGTGMLMSRILRRRK